MKFKRGELVIVTNNDLSGHKFDKGELVRIKDIDFKQEKYVAVGMGKQHWKIKEGEIKKFNSK